MRKTGKRSSRSKVGRRNDGQVDIERVMEEGTLVDRAIRRATREAVLLHKKLGKPVAVWKNGRAVWLKPNQI